MTDPIDSGFFLGAYWGSREESVEDCARRLTDCLDGLAKASPVFDGWYRKGRTKAAASREPVIRDEEQLRDLLDAGRQRRDFGGEPMAELGFNAALWNRQSARPAAWSLTCGAYPPPGVGVLNVFVIDWPDRTPDLSVEDDLAIAKAVMLAVVKAWEPEWATWSTDSLRERQAPAPRHPVLGLLTYFDPTRRVPQLDPDAGIEPLDGGQLLTVDPIGPDLPGRLSRLRDVLARTEALRATS